MGNDIQEIQSLVAERCHAKGFRGAAGRGNHSDTRGGAGARQYIMQGTPRWSRGFKKSGKQAIGKSKGGWNTKLHVVSADDKVIVEIHLSGGECHDSPEGRVSIAAVGKDYPGVPMLMDKAYEGDETRALAEENGHKAVVPPKKNRKNPWEYDKELYKRRNIVERFFRRIKEFRRVFTRYDKLDIMYLAFVQVAVMAIWVN